MSIRRPLPSVGRFDLFEAPGSHDVTVWDGSELIGHVFPKVSAEPAGAWFGKLHGETARKFDSRVEALAHVTGRTVDEVEQAMATRPRKRMVTCQYDPAPHPLDDECVNVTDTPGGE